MTEPYSRIENLHLSPGLAARTRFYSEADRSVIGTIRCGVLFVMAFWSGPAMQAFAKLRQVLEAADPEGRLELIVVDADGCPELYDLFQSCSAAPAGWGETAWIRDGQIVRTSGHGYRPECFDPYTRELLKECLAAPAT